MALVYVHGIGNRGDDRYKAAARRRDGLFRKVLLPAVSPDLADAKILTPFWGRLTVAPRWDLASLPQRGVEQLGPEDDERDALVEGVPSVLSVALRSMADAVDLLYALVEPGTDGEDELVGRSPAIVGYLAAREALFPRDPEEVRYPWLREVRDDYEFVDRLVAEVSAMFDPPEVETLGVRERARDLLIGALRRVNPATLVVGAGRRLAGRNTALLIADVLQYMASRGTRERPGAIVSLVADVIEQADGPRIIIAHSMGGNIVYDLLSHYRPDLSVDVFVTVGSQVGLFEELSLFRESGTDRTMAAPKPPGVLHWLNVVDPADPLSFRAGAVFDGARDYTYPSGAVWAHTAYLNQPNFHARIGRRIAEVLA
ncbi:hypothetical protein [Lentzea sp. NPDC092896]|uniref:hypothetical protein n=1 Tax=Lentzea sp. NPDC092896 TaxID=3364127 RepID=UPI0037F9FB3A